MHLLVVKLVPPTQQELVVESQAQRLLVQVVELVPTRQQVQLVQVLLEQKQLHRKRRLIQDVHRREQLYRQQHQSQEEFQQLAKEFLCQPCQLKLLVVLHQLRLNHPHSSTIV
jgi:hypothetical protein